MRVVEGMDGGRDWGVDSWLISTAKLTATHAEA